MMLPLQETGSSTLDFISANYRLANKIKDDRLEVDHLHQYDLYLLAGNHDLQVCVVNSVDQRCLLLEDFTFKKVDSPNAHLFVLEKIFDSHALLMAGFWHSVTLAFKNKKFALVPNDFFVESELHSYLTFNAVTYPNNENFHYYPHADQSFVNVFAASKKIESWFVNRYPNLSIRFTHQSCAIIEGAMRQFESEQDSMCVFVDKNRLHIVAGSAEQLRFYNQFVIKRIADFSRYILLIMKELDLDKNQHKIMLWGHIDAESNLFRQLYKYIRNISFGNRPKFLHYGYMFDEIEDQQYFDVLNMAIL